MAQQEAPDQVRQNQTPDVQFGVSAEADFEKNTWSFEMPHGFKVWAGEFAIVDKAAYDKLTQPLTPVDAEAAVNNTMVMLGGNTDEEKSFYKLGFLAGSSWRDGVKGNDGWINIKDKLPPYGEEVEVSFDGVEKECNGEYVEKTQCILSGNGGGYFYNKFQDMENKLVLTDVTHWRPIAETPPSPYQKGEAIAFAEWIRTEGYESTPQEFGKWYIRKGTELNRYTEQELFNLYLNQNK